MISESKGPRVNAAPDQMPALTGSGIGSVNGQEEEVKRFMSLGVSPCGTIFGFWHPGYDAVACGRPLGHEGEHRVEATQREIALLAGIPEWM